MGKKKVKKESQSESCKMITLEDVRTREIKYGQRIESLKHCLTYVDDMMYQLEILTEENRLLENWLSYLSCDGLPKPYLPPDIRLFFEKLRFFEAENIEKNIDWTLSVNERSILTQDIFRIDKTREKVKLEKLPNFGKEYEQNINLALKVLKTIEYYLADKNMYSQAQERILQDIKNQKSAVHNEINNFLDRYTYRILSSESAYMEDITARTAEYYYEGECFQIHVWTVKNVPIIFEFLEEPFMNADLYCLNVNITVPFSILEDNLTIRGLHFDFDHFSEHAKTYDQILTIPPESLNAGITDLRDCLANEWRMQVELQLEVRNMMVQKRLEYEEQKRLFDEEEAQKAKDRKNQKDEKEKKKKEKKPPKEVSSIQDNEVPDTWKDFLAKEQKEFEDFLNNIYHPDLLKLEPHELNLKKYLILGGVYQFDFVGKARHFDFNSFNMTWHENDGKLLIKSHIKIKSESTRGTIVKTKMSQSRIDLRGRKSEASMRLDLDPNNSPWFIIQMKLPEYLCLWGEPMPCHYEAEAIGYIEEEEHIEEHLDTGKKNKKGHPRATTVITTPNVAPPATVGETPNELDNVTLALRTSVHAINMQAVHRPSAINLATTILSKLDVTSTADEIAGGIDDFDLDFTLTKAEIRHLERHCLPRIISSYKFPSEFTAEAKERSAKAKSAGGTLIRRHSIQPTDDRTSFSNAEKSERTFSTLYQINPERLFPIFPTPEDVKFRTIISDQMDEKEPTTFYEFLKKLDNLKRYYLGRALRTTNLPPFKPNLKMILKRVTKPVNLSERRSVERTRRSTRHISTHSSYTSVGSRTQRDSLRKELSKVPSHEEEAENQGGIGTKAETSLISIDTRKTYTFSQWTTKYIKHAEFDREQRTLTIWTDRLGVFGLAYKRYEQLPFRFWSLEPSEENPENEVTFTLETQFARVVLFVTGDGVRGYVTDLEKKFVRNRPMYLVIDEPLKDFRELRKRFREKNLNIFTERDASFYIENGYFSQKHLATELHTYCCMCTHALLMRFLYSEWNRLASRRNLILRMVHHKESEDFMCTVRVTPEESTFVTIKELCSDDLNVFNLEYTLTWRNIDFYADVDHLITSMYPSAPEQRVKNPHLIHFLKELLWEIRPLSFS